MENNQLAQIISTRTDLQLFRDRYYTSPLAVAQDQLNSRTHYYSDQTLAYFKARVLYARPTSFGLLFVTVESVPKSMDGSGRGFRAVCFDLFGESVYKPDFEQLHRTRDKALKDFHAWLEKFSELDHYRNKLATQRTQLMRKAEGLQDAYNATYETAEA